MEKVPVSLSVFFIVITFSAVWQFYRATSKSKNFLLVVFTWMAAQFFLGRTSFYNNQDTMPPRFVLLIFPALILIIILLLTPGGKKFTGSLHLKHLTLLHAVRIPVEITLYCLFILKAVPQMMTFEGYNFDIAAGLTAPFIYYFGFTKNKIPDKLLIVWNMISLGLLISIITIAFLSAKTPLQKFAFDQPNIAIAHFPFNWLPSVIVPLVLFAHLATLMRLTDRYRKSGC